MDFHSLSRRELQALCKKNKIPANATNVAMADALKALEIVEGIEEFLQASQSETAQSSIDSLAGLEMTSPYVPPSGVRSSTRRRQAAKEERGTVKSMNRTRQGTLKKLVKNVPEPQDCAIEAPALMKEDLLKECVEDEKEVLMTPAPSGVTGRRRRVKEDSTIKRVYSTRRSTRLAEKNVMTSHEVGHEVSSESVKKKLPTSIGFLNAEMNLKEDCGDSEEVSGVTGVNTSTNSLENPEEYDIEVASAQKQGLPISEEIKLAISSQEKKNSHFEDAPEKMGTSSASSEEEKNSRSEATVPEQKMDCGDVANGEVGIDFGEATAQDDHYCERVSASLNLNHEVEGGGEGEEEKREHPFEAADSEQEMKESDDKKAEIGFDTIAELEVKTSDKTQDPSCESMATLSMNNEAGIGSDKEAEMDNAESDTVEDTSDENSRVVGPNLSADEGMVFDIESEPYHDKSHKTDVLSSESEVEPPQLNDEAATGIDAEAELDEEAGEKPEDLSGGTFIALNLNNEVQQFSGPKDDCTTKIDIAVEDMNKLKKNNTCNEGSDGNAAEYFENIVLENKDDFAVDEYPCNTETQKRMHDVTDLVSEGDTHLDEALERLTELKLQEATKEVSAGAGDADFIDPFGHEECAKPEADSDFSDQECAKPEADADFIDPFAHEESAKPEADLVPQNGEQGMDAAAATQVIAPTSSIGMDEPRSPQIPSAQQLIMSKQTLNSSGKASKTVNDGRMAAVLTDNKENTGSGCKLVVKQKTKNTAAAAAAAATEKKNENLDELSVRKLAKMVRERLEIKSKDGPGRNHHGNKGVSRPALQVLLPEEDESHN